MRMAPDLTWTALAGLLCAAVIALCSAMTLALGVDWTAEPAFAAVISGTTADVVRVVGAHASGAIWAPGESAAAQNVRVDGTYSGYLVRAGARTYGASRVGRDASFASILDIAAQRHRLFWSEPLTSIALTRAIVANVNYRGGQTSVLWHARNWTFEVTDRSGTGYALARYVEGYAASHSWPAGPGYAVVERSADGTMDSWTQWADGDAIVGVVDASDALGAVTTTASMRVYGRP